MAYHVSFSLFLVFLFLKQGFCDDEYRAGFSTESESCSNFENKDMKLDLSLTPSDNDEDETPLMSMQGTLDLGVKIDSEHMLSIDIVKQTDTGEEVMWKVSMPVCDAIKEEDAPWKPVFESMGITDCPIEVKTYEVSDMKIDMDFAKSFLDQRFVGDYCVQVKIEDRQKNEMSCHVLGVCIVEV